MMTFLGLDEDTSLWHTYILHQSLTGFYFHLLMKWFFCFLHANFDPRKKLISGVPSCKCQLENLKLKFYHFSCHFIQERKVTCALSKHFFYIFCNAKHDLFYMIYFFCLAPSKGWGGMPGGKSSRSLGLLAGVIGLPLYPGLKK